MKVQCILSFINVVYPENPLVKMHFRVNQFFKLEIITKIDVTFFLKKTNTLGRSELDSKLYLRKLALYRLSCI